MIACIHVASIPIGEEQKGEERVWGGHPNPELEFFALTSTFIFPCRHLNSYFAGFLFLIYKTAALGLRVKVIPLKSICHLEFFPTWHTCQPYIRLLNTAIKR